MQLEISRSNSAFYIRNRDASTSIGRDFVQLDEASDCDRILLNQYQSCFGQDYHGVECSGGGAGPSRKALRYRDTYTWLVVVVNRERMDGRKDRGG
ncbi:unnamed protein product [Lasius platythorax]|uniref:Uncharacterized protein n=1 Tax=Lasius platythorax TaxID=488582 RepID=A0AAV2N7W4_9HYME